MGVHSERERERERERESMHEREGGRERAIYSAQSTVVPFIFLLVQYSFDTSFNVTTDKIGDSINNTISDQHLFVFMSIY